jgi:hypothetical protein
MNGFLSKLPGPFFDFLVTDGEHWERAGTVQRIVGIKQEYFHNPAALRVQDVIVEVVANCFERAHPSFNYYGPTEFRNENLGQLLDSLGQWIIKNGSCQTEADFCGLVTQYFLEEAQAAVDTWDEQWPVVRDELSATIIGIRDCGRRAKLERKALLVLGI